MNTGVGSDSYHSLSQLWGPKWDCQAHDSWNWSFVKHFNQPWSNQFCPEGSRINMPSCHSFTLPQSMFTNLSPLHFSSLFLSPWAWILCFTWPRYIRQVQRCIFPYRALTGATCCEIYALFQNLVSCLLTTWTATFKGSMIPELERTAQATTCIIKIAHTTQNLFSL